LSPRFEEQEAVVQTGELLHGEPSVELRARSGELARAVKIRA